QRLPLPRLDQPVGQLLEPLAPFSLQDLNDLWPDELVARARVDWIERSWSRDGVRLDQVESRDRCCATRLIATTRRRPMRAWRHGRPVARRSALGECVAKGFVNFPHGLAPLGCRRAAGSRETGRGSRRRIQRLLRRAQSKARWEASELSAARSQPGLFRRPHWAWPDG